MVIIGVYLVVNKNRNLLTMLGASILVIVSMSALLSAPYGEQVRVRYFSSEIPSQDSVTERIQLLENSQKLLEENWQRGVGISNYTLAFSYPPPYSQSKLTLTKLTYTLPNT